MSMSIQIGPFVLLYAPESRSSYWAEPEPAHWYVDGVCVIGATPEECVLRLRGHLLDTFLGTTPERLDRAERLIEQVGTLEAWLLSREY